MAACFAQVPSRRLRRAVASWRRNYGEQELSCAALGIAVARVPLPLAAPRRTAALSASDQLQRPAALASRNLSGVPHAIQRRGLASVIRDRNSGGEKVLLTAARLDQLLEAEITQLSMRDTQLMNLQSILNSTQNAEELALLLHDELPVRFAKRIVMLESLPDWSDKPPIVHVRQLYMTSFKELRLADPEEPEDFQTHLRHVKKRHLHTNQLVRGLKSYSQWCELKEDEVNDWLDRFFVLRVSTNMLIAHYLKVASGDMEINSVSDVMLPLYSNQHDVNPYQSTVNEHCCPHAIVQHSVPIIERLCLNRYGIVPTILVENKGAQPFAFVPRYLFYILSELLKNAARATIEFHLGLESPGERHQQRSSRVMPPIRVVVSGDENGASIRIRDQGGGIPVSQRDRIWSYLYSTAEPVDQTWSRQSVDLPPDVRLLYDRVAADPDAPTNQSDNSGLTSTGDPSEENNGSPLAGLGCGLPLSRLYAKYLGGTIDMQTLPRYGTDVFVYLSRLSPTSESMPML